MIEEYAIITAREENLAVLEIERRTACGLCGQKRGCGNATWGKLLGHKSQQFRAENGIDANVGDSVVVGIDERVILSSVFYLYIVPLLGMLIAAILVDTFFNNELYVLLAAASGLLLGFLWVKWHLVGYGAAKKNCTQSLAVILRRADDMAACENAVKFQTKQGE